MLNANKATYTNIQHLLGTLLLLSDANDKTAIKTVAKNKI